MGSFVEYHTKRGRVFVGLYADRKPVLRVKTAAEMGLGSCIGRKGDREVCFGVPYFLHISIGNILIPATSLLIH